MSHAGGGERGAGAGAVLAIDTATTRIVVATGTTDGVLGASASWPAGYRHGETLLPTIERVLADDGLDRTDIRGVVVGTGPGAFTGLRVGIATAKGLAHGLAVPIVGIPTGAALLDVAARLAGVSPDRCALLLPAGPSDRILVRDVAAPALLPAGHEPDLDDGVTLVAVDLEDRAPTEALALGEAAREELAGELVAVGARRLATGDTDDLARLVPEYVTLPRGAKPTTGELTWSRDPR